MLKKFFTAVLPAFLSACSLVSFQPVETLSRVQPEQGYRLQHAIERSAQDQTAVIMMFSGGGSRAAALAYGVLETLNQYPVQLNGRQTTLVHAADLVYGVSGGSVLAAYYAMHGADVIPHFEQKFLKQNFQRALAKQSLSLANAPRLVSSQFGRGDLLQEQFENTLFGHTTFGDLAANRRNRPFAVISATDMALGNRIDFIQESFDVLCLNLSDMRLARAVAASSAVPFVFSPVALNNNGGNCAYTPLAERIFPQDVPEPYNDKHVRRRIQAYTDSRSRPFIHLLDGGLTDNLGMRGLLDLHGTALGKILSQHLENSRLKRIIVINVNAQNQVDNTVSQTADTPGFKDVAAAIINIPIDQNSQESLRQMRWLSQEWTKQNPDIQMNFVSINLLDLPAGGLRRKVLNLPTSFYLPRDDVNALKQAAAVLLRQSEEFQKLLSELK